MWFPSLFHDRGFLTAVCTNVTFQENLLWSSSLPCLRCQIILIFFITHPHLKFSCLFFDIFVIHCHLFPTWTPVVDPSRFTIVSAKTRPKDQPPELLIRVALGGCDRHMFPHGRGQVLFCFPPSLVPLSCNCFVFLFTLWACWLSLSPLYSKKPAHFYIYT